MAFILFFAFSLLQGALGELICEELPTDLSSFSIASSGKRCLLEKCASTDGTMEFQCKTSEVVVNGMSAWIETEDCIHACGVDRNSIGISSDSLLDPQFTAQLCSPACYQNCPSIIDLYFNLASAEGGSLPDMCANPHRAMSELLSSGAASGPISSSVSAISPAIPHLQTMQLLQLHSTESSSIHTYLILLIVCWIHLLKLDEETLFLSFSFLNICCMC